MATTSLDQFDIRFASLKPGLHEFRFEINDAFFEAFEDSLVEQGKGDCRVTLDKKTNLLTLDFNIEVSVDLVCDRSLEHFNHPISVDRQLVVKFGDEESDLGDDIVVISWEAQIINVAQFIYEYICIAIPMKKIHPDYLGENEEEFGEIIYKSDEEGNDQKIDPRWNALKKLN